MAGGSKVVLRKSYSVGGRAVTGTETLKNGSGLTGDTVTVDFFGSLNADGSQAPGIKAGFDSSCGDKMGALKPKSGKNGAGDPCNCQDEVSGGGGGSGGSGGSGDGGTGGASGSAGPPGGGGNGTPNSGSDTASTGTPGGNGGDGEGNVTDKNDTTNKQTTLARINPSPIQPIPINIPPFNIPKPLPTPLIPRAHKHRNSVADKRKVVPDKRTDPAKKKTVPTSPPLSKKVMERIREDAQRIANSKNIIRLASAEQVKSEMSRLIDFYNKGVVNSFEEIARMARYQKTEVVAGDRIINMLKNDRGFQEFQKRAEIALNNGKEKYFEPNVRTGSIPKSIPLIGGWNNETDELFWLLHYVGPTASKTKANGKIEVRYHIHDHFDALPDSNRSEHYNKSNAKIDWYWRYMADWSYPWITIDF